MPKTISKQAGKETPLMKQYRAVKIKYPGALLLFRVGDFYETFGEDAIKASKILDIVLTKRSNGAASQVELAGFPHHALDTYLPKLVRAGQRVAICDQLEDPKMAQGIVKRGVTELVTPGLSLHDQILDQRTNNYLASLYLGKEFTGVAFLDLSTGEFLTSRGSLAFIDKLLQSLKPTELVFNKSCKNEFLESLKSDYHTYGLDDWVYSFDYGYEKLVEHFQTNSLKGFGIENLGEGIIAAGAILHYLESTEHHQIKHITSISRIEEDQYVWLDKFTIRNLELLHSPQEDGVPLIKVLDKTVSPMGARLMKMWMALPLKQKDKIENRLDCVAHLVQNQPIREALWQHLEQVGDLERLISKVAVGRINPREMVHLLKALQQIPAIQDVLKPVKVTSLKKLTGQLDHCQALVEKIEKELKEEPPLASNQGGLIKEGVSPELDELRQIAYTGKDVLLQIQKREKEKTGISSLKIAYNKVFGYYLEVTHAHKDKVPADWVRKQTLVNAERYITEELKTYEEKILTAEEKIVDIEYRLFQRIVETAINYLLPIQNDARILAQLDCFSGLAQGAIQHGYNRPEINQTKAIDIKEGRHPVIEHQLPLGEPYIPNDVYLDNEEHQILVITGPNMAGKSALLRQTALIVLMAQIGSFVPASSAKIGITDKIFSRVGASDNLSRGESTFMVEMIETASILNNLSDRSLILMDEIGRGTSTYDGISIAWSIVEYLHNHPKFKAKTLFATHYHELNELAEDLRGVNNYNVSVKEVGKKVIFMRKLKEGGSAHSFGIHVAQMAGMPNQVVVRANEIMTHLEKDKLSHQEQEKIQSIPTNFQMNLFELDPQFAEVKKILDQLDINTISPVEALLTLNEIKTLLKEQNSS